MLTDTHCHLGSRNFPTEELAYTQAPKAMKPFVLSLFLLTVSFGNFFTSGVKYFILNEDGSSKFPGASEFWFWTGLVGLAAVLFVFVSKSYKSKTYLQEEEVDPVDA
jgi:POT family proton-dependent oligopeptide transporter